MKKILMVSSEAVPYIKTGGLADVVGSLPRYINKNEFDVRVILPKYACMKQSFLPELQFVLDDSIEYGAHIDQVLKNI